MNQCASESDSEARSRRAAQQSSGIACCRPSPQQQTRPCARQTDRRTPRRYIDPATHYVSDISNIQEQTEWDTVTCHRPTAGSGCVGIHNLLPSNLTTGHWQLRSSVHTDSRSSPRHCCGGSDVVRTSRGEVERERLCGVAKLSPLVLAGMFAPVENTSARRTHVDNQRTHTPRRTQQMPPAAGHTTPDQSTARLCEAKTRLSLCLEVMWSHGHLQRAFPRYTTRTADDEQRSLLSVRLLSSRRSPVAFAWTVVKAVYFPRALESPEHCDQRVSVCLSVRASISPKLRVRSCALCTVCGAGSMQWSGVRPSVRPVDRQQQRCAAVCCWARAADVDRQWSERSAGAQQQMRAASCREPRNEAQHRLVYACACADLWQALDIIIELLAVICHRAPTILMPVSMTFKPRPYSSHALPATPCCWAPADVARHLLPARTAPSSKPAARRDRQTLERFTDSASHTMRTVWTLQFTYEHKLDTLSTY